MTDTVQVDMGITLITRADDFGSSHSANEAIIKSAEGRFIKNVSCMAPGPAMEQGAPVLKRLGHLCLGMHVTLNAEWDLIKWPPVADIRQVPQLVNANGALKEDPLRFLIEQPPLSQVMLEVNAQLDYLTRLGLNIQYVDSHMLPERYLIGLKETLADWAQKKGLIYHMPYYRFPDRMAPEPASTLEEKNKAIADWLDHLQSGQYISIMHPAVPSREMLLCSNRQHPMGQVRDARCAEFLALASKVPERLCEERGIVCLRYDEALPLEDAFVF